MDGHKTSVKIQLPIKQYWMSIYIYISTKITRTNLPSARFLCHLKVKCSTFYVCACCDESCSLLLFFFFRASIKYANCKLNVHELFSVFVNGSLVAESRIDELVRILFLCIELNHISKSWCCGVVNEVVNFKLHEFLLITPPTRKKILGILPAGGEPITT